MNFTGVGPVFRRSDKTRWRPTAPFTKVGRRGWRFTRRGRWTGASKAMQSGGERRGIAWNGGRLVRRRIGRCDLSIGDQQERVVNPILRFDN